MKRLFLIVFVLVSGGIMPVLSQCKMQNTAFSDNEKLEYTLHFNWKFIWIEAGVATLAPRRTTYAGDPAHQDDNDKI